MIMIFRCYREQIGWSVYKKIKEIKLELSLHVLTDLNSQQNERVTGSQKKLHADAVDVTKYPKLS